MIQFTTLLDEHGFLKDHRQWSADIAYIFAKEENIILTEAHWQIIDFLREYYEVHKTAPAIRLLVKSLKEKYGSNIGNSLYLQTLFPISPAVQAAKIAGLPKPKRCI
ncbi:TusE/DsrC/DsvC family sulfur relay protein [Cysteiniphilum sp. QT6929]|uniref:TusE/DsrC/DsvC family sulfur relay protein n=1 Tax=Cysteiniphilum TaxID=2056696 RepID=UPI0024B333BF|nr:TusE/DsrC/DsvC family sulfur relay protein [Cysteiniphilum sp. QT6929]WHN65822.1 TusE/DsrC/DsvC family sulfur relay protein [Cysteiniphilum sp. QT6929]